MTLYCDESGGVSAGAMTFAAIAIDADSAKAIVERFRAITGLRGELKGSRISLTERGLLIEILAQHDFRGWVAVADGPRLHLAKQAGDSDLSIYSRLLDQTVGAFLPSSGGACADIVIDEGRYDPSILSLVRSDIQASLGHWGRASLADSRRSAGIQIADVIANCFFNINAHTDRAIRIASIVEPLTRNGRLKTIALPV